MEALALELAAQRARAAGHTELAQLALDGARGAYERWGARGKLSHLETSAHDQLQSRASR